MSVFAVYIQKETDYFGGRRKFGNTYHYQTAPAQPFNDQAVVDQIVAAERPVTDNQVDFVGWTTWGPTDGSTFDNVIRESGELSGTGGNTIADAYYKEACMLVVWPMPRSPVTNRRRWLRKFLRMSGPSGLSPNQLSGQDPLTPADRSLMVTTYADPVTVVTSGGASSELCSEDGVLPNADPIVRPFLYTRQIGA
jgi:hypothetical protein